MGDLSEADIQPFLDKRRPGTSRFTTQRQEPDQVRILSGVFEGRTTGTPVSLMIENVDQRSKDYSDVATAYRPGHADYSYDASTPYYVQLLNKSATAYPLAPLVRVEPGRVGTTDIGVPQDANAGETYGASLHLKWVLSDAVEVRSISAYRHLEQAQKDNGIGAHAGGHLDDR